ncbi:transposase [Actinobacillus pleuropneumoniae]|nr:transposase [Actinobacillus pleuropneumoniae]ASU15662.1 hypothetical protein CHY23_00894 [Actinobacillus pleuropneumoniae]MCI1069792.1 transposase [Actinobacillus pleuropneumoniae]WBY04932.1 hypothetical protein PE794_09910 [Actinobacillus pleuropneumoniae]
MDTTHFKQRFAVLVLVDSLSSKPVYFRFIPAEKNQYYFEAISELMEKGIKIQSITCDGRRGLLNAYPDIPTQMCHFHQVGRGIFYLTKSPKFPAGKALLEYTIHLNLIQKRRLIKHYCNGGMSIKLTLTNARSIMQNGLNTND